MQVKMSEFEKLVDEDDEGIDEDHPDYAAVDNAELGVYGVRARVMLHIPVGDGGHPEYDGGSTVATFIQTPGVWGITAHHEGESHITEHYTQEAALLAVMLRALGVEVIDDRPEPAPLEVCPRCLERTGGIAEPGTGNCFALELKRDLRVGGMTWAKNSESVGPDGLCDVLRSMHAPHHLVTYYGAGDPPRPCSPICLLPADAIEVWTVDDGSDGDE